MFQSVTPILRNISPSKLSMGLNTSEYFTLKLQVQSYCVEFMIQIPNVQISWHFITFFKF